MVHSPVDSPEAQAQSGAVNRLRAALGRGGESAAFAILWPADLPAPESGAPIYRLPPHAHPAFRQPQARPPGFAEDYLYAPSPPAGRLDLLAAAWSWVSAGLGEDWALVVSGLSERQIADLRRQCAAAGAAGPVQPAAPRAPAEHAALIQHAGAVLPLAAPRPWADPYLQALAGGRPLAAEETALASARVGPAGYLTPPGDARLLGAAALTVLVEEQVAETLARAAEERARGWLIPAFGDRLVEVYRQVLREEAA